MTVQLNVPDMACGACSATITKAVTTLDPTAIVDADLKTKWVKIEAQVDEARLRGAIAAAGYTIAE
jgi:copper chaperone